MIQVSRSSRRGRLGFLGSLLLPLLLLLLPLVGSSGCELGHTCTAKGCLEGLVVSLDGNFDPEKAFEIDVSTVTPTPEVVPVMSCSRLPSSRQQPDFRCTSVRPHSQFGNIIQIRDNELKKVLVVVSTGGTKLGEQMFTPDYSTREINGAGCGTCTQAAISVTIP